ncbi:MAG TPA: phenylalanine--tRNA ligase subunit beta [Acidimicrobiales bacterium]|nr:phenylalanine--tRNA ligase subunit beta [Acidimicrobiales bacterium]
MKVARSWLETFVDLTETNDELREILDDLGLVVEGMDLVGEGLDDVVVARVNTITAIEGADRIRLVNVDAGGEPLDIVCGAMNFAVGDLVPLAPVGAVLPGGFAITARSMRGVLSNGMLCSGRELRLSDDHGGLLILRPDLTPGEHLCTALAITPDVVFDLSIEGNRPDAWSVEGVARDLAVRLGREMRDVVLAETNSSTPTASLASARIDDPDLCGRLTVSLLRGVRVGPSPAWVARRVESAGMRSINNVVDASNFVMLELGQPTHPYDATRVARQTLGARRARAGETLETLDGVTRNLAMAGRGLGDTGEDCVIVDGDDHVLGLAGIMGGASSEIDDATTQVLLEAAYFDPMAIARSSKRHALRSEASARFERGVDPLLALRAVARFAAVLRESSPDLEWLADPLDVAGTVPTPAVLALREGDVERLLGVALGEDEVKRLLEGLRFTVRAVDAGLEVVAPSARPDVRTGARGRADVIEEIARLHGYRQIPRRTPTWVEPGALTRRQRERRVVRDLIVDLGALEAWTPSLGSDEDFDRLHPGLARVRVTNPLAADESVLRATMVTGLVKTWAKNVERGLGDVVLAEMGVVFAHPDTVATPRVTRGGVGGQSQLVLPLENERLTVLLGRVDDDASRALRLWSSLSGRLALRDVIVRSTRELPAGWHATRSAVLVDATTEVELGYVGEVDPELVAGLLAVDPSRRVGLFDVDLDALLDPEMALRRSELTVVPSRYPSAMFDLALVASDRVSAHDLALALRTSSPLVEEVRLFDVYRGANLAAGTRSLAYALRLSAFDHTLSEGEIAATRQALLDAAGALGAVLRST